MRFPDHIEKLYQEFLARRGPTKCRVCQCDIPSEKRRGRPRLTCITCDVYQAALAMVPPEPRPCEWCGVDFRPQRKVARFCSDTCRRGAYSELRRSRAF
jgi:predicted nucleic acid-binding Zn ribbon protein